MKASKIHYRRTNTIAAGSVFRVGMYIPKMLYEIRIGCDAGNATAFDIKWKLDPVLRADLDTSPTYANELESTSPYQTHKFGATAENQQPMTISDLRLIDPQVLWIETAAAQTIEVVFLTGF